MALQSLYTYKYHHLIIALLLSLESIAVNQNYYFEKISPESGFAYNAVTTIAEDCNGMVWFGCSNGLYYYNTSTIEKIEFYPDSISESHSLKINKIYKDNNCTMWVCTQNGLFKRNKTDDTFTRIKFRSRDSVNSTNQVIENIVQFKEDLFYVVIEGSLFYFTQKKQVLNKVVFAQKIETPISFIDADQVGNIMVGTEAGKIFIGKSPYSDFKLFYDSVNDQIKTICHDNNKLFIGYKDKGVVVINNRGKKLYEINHNLTGNFHLPDNRVRDIIRTNTGDIWIGTYNGILVISKNKCQIITSTKNSGLPYNSIYDLHMGINGGIWISTWAGGVAYYKDVNYKFKHIKKVPNEITETISIISSFTQDNSGNVWIGSEKSGINLFAPKNANTFTSNQSISKKDLYAIKSFTTADSENIFIGTIYQGIWHFNTKSKSLKKLNGNSSLDSTIISSLAFMDNELWFATRGSYTGLNKYNLKNNEFKPYTPTNSLKDKNTPIRIINLLFDSSHKLWICTEDGLLYKNKDENTLNRCFENDSIYHLSHTWVYTVFEDVNGDIWIGTKGKGIFKYSLLSGQLKQIGHDKSLYKSDIYGIIQDESQNLWFSTNQGIYSYNEISNKTTLFSSYDGISGNQFNPNAAFSSKDGEIFFGSPNGFCFINPKQIKINTIAPKVFLSKLLINNKPYTEENSFVSNSLTYTEINNITLKHDQNSLTFGVVANNFIKPQKNKFRYRLKNYEEKWVETSQNKDITFTKIPPGKYTLEVLGANNDNIWSKTPLSLHFEILAPIWKRWYAILLYIAISVLLLFIVWKELKLKITLRKEILSEKYKSEASEIVFEEKLRFFTNISHEIRTPLTLIISPLNNLISKFQFDEKTNQQLLVIKRNSSRLLRLTNQILDFRLLEVGKLKAQFQKTDIVATGKEVFNCFEPTVKEKKINFLFNSNYKSMWVSVDPDMIEKIIYNLVENALKYSEEKGQVILSIERKELTPESYNNFISQGNQFIGKSIEIKVSDFGKGIKKDMLPSIWERFTVDSSENKTGTGIGLHLCQEYAKLNNANLLVTSKEGEGSTFILNIPFQKNCEYEEKSIAAQFSYNSNENDNTETKEDYVLSGNRPVLLLVEVNDELRSYLKEFLSKYFKVLTAKNGQQAFEVANEVIPNLMITDILMPNIDGIELTEKMKSNNKTKNIPIIILTALSESKYQKESLLKGVDSFLTKPVDEGLLLAQIENILTKKEILSKYQESENNNLKADPKLYTTETTFIEKAQIIVENNLRNSDFNLEDLLKKLNVSRSTLHRKIKASSNQNPTEFIRDIRLKKAVELMKSKNLNIDEIGTYVGFNSTSYFIRSFKKKYGKTPKEFYKTLNN